MAESNPTKNRTIVVRLTDSEFAAITRFGKPISQVVRQRLFGKRRPMPSTLGTRNKAVTERYS